MPHSVTALFLEELAMVQPLPSSLSNLAITLGWTMVVLLSSSAGKLLAGMLQIRHQKGPKPLQADYLNTLKDQISAHRLGGAL
jgi:hypothetical protein